MSRNNSFFTAALAMILLAIGIVAIAGHRHEQPLPDAERFYRLERRIRELEDQGSSELIQQLQAATNDLEKRVRELEGDE